MEEIDEYKLPTTPIINLDSLIDGPSEEDPYPSRTILGNPQLVQLVLALLKTSSRSSINKPRVFFRTASHPALSYIVSQKETQLLNAVHWESGDCKTPVFDARHYDAAGCSGTDLEQMVEHIAQFLQTVAPIGPRKPIPMDKTYGYSEAGAPPPPEDSAADVQQWLTESARCRGILHDFAIIGRHAIPTVVAWYQWA